MTINLMAGCSTKTKLTGKDGRKPIEIAAAITYV
jgi:hypothetical protein